MKALNFFLTLILFGYNCTITSASKIVGLMQVRNEANVVEQALRCLSLYTDEMVVLDDFSQDKTVEIIETLSHELHITRVIKRDRSYWQTGAEYENRNALLTAGREIGGTHFIVMDADEMFTAPCVENNWLRNHVLRLQPGSQFAVPLIDLWGSCFDYRDDALLNPYMDLNSIPTAFADNKTCYYNHSYSPTGTIHVPRIPCTGSGNIKIRDINYSLLHFKSVNLDDRVLKRYWYICLEFIRAMQRNSNNVRPILDFYSASVFTIPGVHSTRLSRAPHGWYNYSFFNEKAFLRTHEGRRNDFKIWFEKYGIDCFRQILSKQDLDWIIKEINK